MHFIYIVQNLQKVVFPPWMEAGKKKTISGKMLVVWGKNQLGIKLREPAYLLQKCILGEFLI